MRADIRNLFFLASAVAAAPVAEPQDGIWTGNEPHLEHAFRLDDGCSRSQKEKVMQAWEDVKTYHSMVYPIMWGHMEERFFGRDIRQRPEEMGIITTVFGNIRKLIDGENKGSITITCGKDVPNKEGNSCQRVYLGGIQGQVGAYAVSDGNDFGKATIVLCSPFFAPGNQALSDVKADVERNGPGDQNRGLTGIGTLLLHELTHLAPITETDGMLITDQLRNEMSSALVYGFLQTEKLAWGTGRPTGEKRELLAARNADNYACYVSSKWYIQSFNRELPAIFKPRREGEGEGGCSVPTPFCNPNKVPTKKKKAVNVVLQRTPHGMQGNTMEWRFFTSGPFDEECTDGMDDNLRKPAEGVDDVGRQDAYPGGTFELTNVDGEQCEYKNDGTGNTGMVWCNGKGHGCVDAKRHETVASCGQGRDSYSQRQVVTCEWEVDV